MTTTLLHIFYRNRTAELIDIICDGDRAKTLKSMLLRRICTAEILNKIGAL